MSDETTITEGAEKVIRTYHNGRYEIRSKLNLIKVTDENMTLRGKITEWGLIITFIGGFCGLIYAFVLKSGETVPVLNIHGSAMFIYSIVAIFAPVGIVMVIPMDTLIPHTTISETKNKLWVKLYRQTRSRSGELGFEQPINKWYLFNANERADGIKYLKEGIKEIEACIAQEEERRIQPAIQEQLHDDIIAGLGTSVPQIKEPEVPKIPEKTYREDRFTDIDLFDNDE
jgi:hypothetical protein